MSSSDNPTTPPPPPLQKPRRKGTGRRKIPIERIERTEYRRVAFAKRRTSIFNKAKELSVLCGAETAVITFSQAGKPFTYGYPSVDAVVARFLGEEERADDGKNHKQLQKPAGDDDKNEKQTIVPWWDAPIDDLGLEELEEREKKLEELRDKVHMKLDKQWLSL